MLAVIAMALALLTVPLEGRCDPRGGPRLSWSAEARAETRARGRAACAALGASPIVCAWVDASIVRESSGRASVRHRRGKNEDGLGPLALSLRWHGGKWPERADPAFCTVEVSVLVALEIAHRAVANHGARHISDVQAVFAFRTYRDEDGQLHVARSRHADARLCAAMTARGFDCRTPIAARDLGRRVPLAERAQIVSQMRAP